MQCETSTCARSRRSATTRRTSCKMLSTHGPTGTARRLITSTKPSEGFTALWERRRLDLTVEAHVVQDRFQGLFTAVEREAARQRLAEYGYTPSS